MHTKADEPALAVQVQKALRYVHTNPTDEHAVGDVPLGWIAGQAPASP